MNIMTRQETLSVKEKIQNLREKHQHIFDNNNMPGALFFPKMAYRPRGKDELYISFFASELKRESRIYTEFISSEYYPEDSNRTLWMWNYNPHWEEEYETTEPNSAGQVRYLVPVSELIKVQEAVKTEQKDSFTFLGDSIVQDIPLTEMTVRDLAAIMTGKPVSKKEWLNKIITQK